MKFTIVTIMSTFAIMAFAQAPSNAGVAVNLPSLGVSSTRMTFEWFGSNLLNFISKFWMLVQNLQLPGKKKAMMSVVYMFGSNVDKIGQLILILLSLQQLSIRLL